MNKARGLQPVGLTRMDFAYMEPTTTQETEFVWRRLADTLKLFGQELDGHFWLAILIPVLIIAFAYVIWMYVRDGRSVGWGWASLLGALRIAVYLILAGIGLLVHTFVIPAVIMGILALAAGILILIGK